MKNTISTGLVVLAASWGTVGAASFDGSQPLLCDSATLIECLPVEGCRQVAAEAIAAPSFIRVDLSKKMVTAKDAESAGRTSPIKRSQKLDGKLILQGAEDGLEGVRDGLGWTIAIAEDTGKMVLTASGDEVAITIFGNCTTL